MMSQCTFCGAKEQKQTPICHSCGAIRYPIDSRSLAKTKSSQEKLKLSAAVAATVITPGSLIVLALIGAYRVNNKNKKRP